MFKIKNLTGKEIEIEKNLILKPKSIISYTGKMNKRLNQLQYMNIIQIIDCTPKSTNVIIDNNKSNDSIRQKRQQEILDQIKQGNVFSSIPLSYKQDSKTKNRKKK